MYKMKTNSAIGRVFPRRLTHGGFLTMGYCWRTVGYCWRTIGYCFLEICVGRQGLDGGDEVIMEGSPSPPTRENPDRYRLFSC